ncbi:MarR family winged helix-turn-helix transcriptional regulator [Blastococcus xanthinilyticus]|uniref:DNA-binding MarR family transcriptional regulator n=1 Tax=Blastococcus xanthinilyticus TaxID=1564164 RepID=A0A5S5D6X8_9ACTN|nr:MarR family transcriptional regulator [Blastococcus xanthinilyticus]TYP90522.1 DNA-binding MarR family transcriptional regulator [Blastococcus xanthinilyticus]
MTTDHGTPPDTSTGPALGFTRAEASAWMGLLRVATRLPAALDTQMRGEVDLTCMEFYVLAFLDAAPDATLPLKAIADEAHVTLSRLSHVVARLEAAGMLDKRTAPDNGRVRLATLTDDGRRLVRRGGPAHEHFVRATVLAGLTAADLDHLTRLMAVIADRLANT